MSIEDEEGGIELENNQNESKNDKGIPNIDTEEEDSDDDLRILSNIKKYKISNLCHQNLFTLGWSKLDENMEEDRRWTKMIQN